MNRQKDRERQKLLLEKLEELHEIISQLRQAYGDLFLMTIDEKGSMIKERISVPTEKLQMLVGFYAPSLSVRLENVEMYRAEYDRVLFDWVHAQNQDDKTKKSALAVTSMWKQRLDQACTEMQTEVIALSKKYI
jgi:hypothetical protein